MKINFIMSLFVYGLFLLIDSLFGIGLPLVYRIKYKKNKYHVQARWLLSPFWSRYGIGDVLGTMFTPVIFDTKKEAEEFIENESQ